MVIPIDKIIDNIAFVCKRFYVSVITRELGLNHNLSTDTYNNADGLSVNDITDKNIRYLKIRFGIYNIPIEYHGLPNIYSMHKMHQYSIKARFIIASPKTFYKTFSLYYNINFSFAF